jgi:hypothetical protein
VGIVLGTHRIEGKVSFGTVPDWVTMKKNQLLWVPGPLSLGVKRQGHEADHSPPSSTDVKNGWSYTSTYPIRLHGVVLSLKKEHRDKFAFTLLYFTYTSSGNTVSCF